MQRLGRTFREHLHFIVIVTGLTLIMTFPTIVYVFRTDVFWLPTGDSHDVYIKIWDVWYGSQFLTGQADRFFTTVMFYPEGLSLTLHPFFVPHAIAVNLLSVLLPISNAFSLVHLLIIWTSALSAYVYIRWLIDDKWIALFGAVVFGLGPHVVGNANHTEVSFVTTIPLVLYGLHRGVVEKRSSYIVIAGLLTGFTSISSLYGYVCIAITLTLAVAALAKSRLRDKGFWRGVILLLLTIVISSAWRLYPLLSSVQGLDAALSWHGEFEIRTDLISFFVNHGNPVISMLGNKILQTPLGASLSMTSYIGYFPILLVGIGLFNTVTRRKMLPWLSVWIFFLVLRLGSFLSVNGIEYSHILLPKFYLNRLIPTLFASFYEADIIMMGALLPLAVLTCYGIVALREMRPRLGGQWPILLLIGVVAAEYYIPVKDNLVPQAQFEFIDWLKSEDNGSEIRLVNLPMGRKNSKRYNLYQSLGGYPHAEGAIARTPDSAFEYIKANYLLNAWYNQHPVNCELADRDSYLSGLAELEDDGFSHVILHHTLWPSRNVADSFLGVSPAYVDDFVSIYRIDNLPDVCPSNVAARRVFDSPYAEILLMPSVIHERPGTVITFHSSQRADADFLRYYGNVTSENESLVHLSYDEQDALVIQSTSDRFSNLESIIQDSRAIWLVNDPQVTAVEELDVHRILLGDYFKFCRRFVDRDDATMDYYLEKNLPCEAVAETSAFEVNYDNGDRLRNLFVEVVQNEAVFYLAWSKASQRSYGFSMQFFDDRDEKVQQYDSIVTQEPVAVHRVNTSTLGAGNYTIKLIVYDFETGKSRGGTLTESGERFERELEIARISL